MTNTRIITVVLAWLVPTLAFAHGPHEHPADPNLHVDPSVKDCSVEFAPGLTQSAFRSFARQFGSISAFKLASAPPTLGQWHVAVDLEEIWFSVEEKSAAWNDTFAHPDAYHELGSNLAFPKLRARVGVMEDLDVGVYFSAKPGANYGWLGLEGKYRLLSQSGAMPISLALRAAYTKTLFVKDMDMHAITADVAVGRTFWNVLTPYLGFGNDLVLVRETSDAVRLHGEAQFVPHALGGLEVRFWHVALGAEAHLAVVSTFQAQLSGVL